MDKESVGEQALNHRKGYAPRRFISFIAQTKSEPNAQAAKDDKKNRNEAAIIKYNRISTWVNSIMAVIAVFSFVAAIFTWSVLHSQLDEMRDEQRPWVKDTDISIEKVQVQKDEILVFISVKFANIGHSPAFNVRVFARLLLPELERWDFLNERSSCNDAKSTPATKIGSVLFPGDIPETLAFNFGRPMVDIRRARESRTRKTRVGWEGAFGRKEADEIAATFEKLANYTSFSIIGCIAYTFNGTQSVHGTSFSFVLDRDPAHPDVRNGITAQAINTAIEGVIDGKELRMTPIPMGRYAD